MFWRGSKGEQQQCECGSSHPPVPAPQAQQTRSFFIQSEAMGPRISGYFWTWALLQTAAQILIQNFPEGFQRVSSGGQMFWLIVQPGLPQLNFPKSGLFTFMNVPGMGPKLTPRLFPSTLLKSQKSGFPVLERVSSTKVAGDWPVIPLHSTPKLFVGVPQSPVSQTNLPSIHLHPVLAQNLMATVLALIENYC